MIEIRELVELPDLVTAVNLQREIWGFSDLDLLPVRLFVVATKIGGQVLGAFDGDRMVGFSIAIPGAKSGGRAFLHSQMMGVVDGYRNAGVGRLLKFRQRELALAAGINLIEWTFDPLETKNAYFNIERLGAVVSRYVLNQYGNTSSKLHAGLPTDRCIAEWFLDKEKTPVDITARIEVPYEGARTREVQARISQQFLEHFRAGRTVVRFERGETHGAYLLADKDGLQ
ncbi:MAG: acetyltransferase [Acidobacteriaceae bacterium]|nr:acetyltransferase [Acidobacteriaceae bacterium]